MHGGRDGFDRFYVEGAGQVFDGDFDAGEIVVGADADLLEAELVEGFFALLDPGEGLAGDGLTVLDARGEAGGGRLVPETKTGCMGKAPNGALVELSVG